MQGDPTPARPLCQEDMNQIPTRCVQLLMGRCYRRARTILFALVLALVACSPKTFNPADPASDEYLLARLAQCIAEACFPAPPQPCEGTSTTTKGWHSYLGNGSDSFFGLGVCGRGELTLFYGSGQGNIPVEGVSPLQTQTNGGNDQPFLLATRGDGSPAWLTFVGSPTATGRFVSAKPVGESDLMVLAELSDDLPSFDGVTPAHAYGSGTDLALFRINSSGRVIWYTFVPAAGNQTADDLTIAPDGGWIVSARTDSNIANIGALTPIFPYVGVLDGLLIKLSADGSVEWYTMAGSAGNDGSGRSSVLANGNIVWAFSAGAAVSLGTNVPLQSYNALSDVILSVFTQTGNLVWYTHLGSPASDFAASLLPHAGGDFFLSGSSGLLALPNNPQPLLPFNMGNDGFLLRMTSSGTVVWHSYFGSTAGDTIQGVAFAQAETMRDYQRTLLVTADVGAGIASLGGHNPLQSYTGMADNLFARMSVDGQLEWYTMMGGANYENTVSNPVPTRDGGLAFSSSSGGGGLPYGQSPRVNYPGGDAWWIGRLKGNGRFSD